MGCKNGKYSRLDVPPERQFPLPQEGSVAADKQAANDIMASLPLQQTEAIALNHAERNDFQTRLDKISPYHRSQLPLSV